MNTSIIYNPIIWPSVLVVILLIILAIYSGRRRYVPGALPFMIACLFAVLWAVGSIMESIITGIEATIFWVNFQGVCQLPIAIAVTCFILEYAWPGRWLTRRNLILLSAPWLVSLVLVLTNNIHHLIWIYIHTDEAFIINYGPAYWLIFVYGYCLAIVDIIVFIWLFLHSPQHRWPVLFMLIGLFMGRTIFLLQKSSIIYARVPIDLYGMAMEFLMYSIALFGFRILDPIPLARKTAIEQLRAGMLVLDIQGKIVSVNKAARVVLGKPKKELMGCSITNFLPTCTMDLMIVGRGQIEICLGPPLETHYYQLEASALNDWRGLAVGILLMLYDITDEKRAEAQLMEQEQALATMRERERLARELHDNAGQLLAYVNMQAQAIHKWVHDGETEKAEEQLTQLANIAKEAHNDLRESIFNLSAGPMKKWSFFPTLKQHLDTYQDTYAVRTELIFPKDLDVDAIKPGVGVQLLRVIQEALTNAHQHGHANSVCVTFTRQDGRARIVITDDGCGFDSEQLSMDVSYHFGLVFMSERIEQIGGNIKIVSKPGAGAQVLIEVPIREEAQEQ
jgi:signal transduction histidine kinase